MKLLATLFLVLFISFPAFGRSRDRKPASDADQRISKIEDAIERLEREMEILKTQSRLVIRRTTVSFLNAWYVKANLSILVPRSSGFTGTTDTGLGAHVGLGRYLGRNHVFDLTFDWDVYPAATLRYRLEFHNNSPTISLAPVIGVKQKLLNVRPFDNFLGNPSEVKSTFLVVGAYLGVPMSKSVLSGEINALINGQVILTVTAGVHFFI
ncbi:MAG: hypothetical protein KDD39_01255 [Bdellovibrionales bacterium]|nr:hypothetical protein [Bdellovibrionales bacterium]